MQPAISPSQGSISGSSSGSVSSLSASAVHLAAAQQNALLVALIHEAEALLSQSRRVGTAGAERARKLERAWAKLEAAQEELAKQAASYSEVVDSMADRCATLDARAQALHTDFTERQAELQAVLDGLAQHTLAACLQPARSPSPVHTDPASSAPGAPPPSSSLQTLYDFVDGESLAQVHAHFLRSMERLAQLGESARALLARAEAQLGEARTLEAQIADRMRGEASLTMPVLSSMPLAAPGAALPPGAPAAAAAAASSGDPSDGSVLAQCKSAHANLELEVAHMAPLFAAMCSSYDRVRQARQAASGAAQSPAAAAATSADVASEISSMQQALQQMQVHSHRASTLSAHIESCSGAHSSLYAHMLLLFNSLQAFGPSLNSGLATFSTLDVEFESYISSGASGVAELRNLAGFYVEFEHAYEAMLDEIQRRHRQMAHQLSFMHSVRQELEEMYTAEARERDAFAATHGRFLPPGLCPAILAEQAQLVRIVPEEIVTALPVWVPTQEEEERQSRARHRQHMQRQQQQQQQQSQQLQQQQQQQQQHPPPSSVGDGHPLDSSGSAAQVTPALSSSAHAATMHQQQQQQPHAPTVGDGDQLDSLQNVLSQQYSGLTLHSSPATAASASQSSHSTSGMVAPTPLLPARPEQQWMQGQQQPPQPQRSGQQRPDWTSHPNVTTHLPPSSLLAHSASQPVKPHHLHTHQPTPQLPDPAHTVHQGTRTASQPAKPVARSFDDDD